MTPLRAFLAGLILGYSLWWGMPRVGGRVLSWLAVGCWPADLENDDE